MSQRVHNKANTHCLMGRQLGIRIFLRFLPVATITLGAAALEYVQADELCRPGFQYVEDSHGHGCRRYTERDSFVRDGHWKVFYKNDAVASEGSWKNNQRHGLWKHYFPGGNLKEETEYRDGTAHGTSRIRNRRGVLISEGAYRQGVKTGEWKEWHENGNLKHVISYAKSGKPMGVSKIYHPNRQL